MLMTIFPVESKAKNKAMEALSLLTSNFKSWISVIHTCLVIHLSSKLSWR